MAASNFTNLYGYGQWGYMGIGPMPARSFTLTLTADSTHGYFTLGACTSTHIVAYNPNNTSQYAVYSGTSFTVYHPNSSTYELVRYSGTDTPLTQSITIDYESSNWDFHGLTSLEGAALCIATDASGSAPDGSDYASIATDRKDMITYETIVIRMADKINGCDIYAKRAEQDKDGNDIVPIPSVTGNGGKILKVNAGGTATEWAAETTELPTVTGNANKVLTVNSGATGVEWANVPSELPTVSGNSGKILAVNSGATGVEWVAKPTTPTVDQTYDSTSTNAQSGVAVASAISTALGPVETALANL